MEEDDRNIPFGGESVYYEYKCKDCGWEHRVEDIVIDALLASGKYKEGQMPMLDCPRCHGDLIYIGDEDNH